MEDEFRLKILLFAIFFQILDNLFFPNPRTSHVTSHIHIDNNFQKNTTNLLNTIQRKLFSTQHSIQPPLYAMDYDEKIILVYT